MYFFFYSRSLFCIVFVTSTWLVFSLWLSQVIVTGNDRLLARLCPPGPPAPGPPAPGPRSPTPPRAPATQPPGNWHAIYFLACSDFRLLQLQTRFSANMKTKVFSSSLLLLALLQLVRLAESEIVEPGCPVKRGEYTVPTW